MITEYEDYCSYEVAKLLKEKGFPQKYDIMVYNEEDYEDKYCYCPTHQEVRRWFLKKYNIFITILFVEEDNRFGYTIEDIVKKKYIGSSGNSSYKEPEEADDASIKYCLENLI